MKNLFPFLLILSFSTMAQKMKLISGSMHGLKGQSSYDLKFVYDSIVIGEDKPEKVYLEEIRKRWEEREFGTNTSAAFERLWFEDRARLYEPAFINTFEQYGKVKLNDKNAKYTLILKTKRIEGGWNGGVMTQSGEIDGELWIVESADNNHVIAKIYFVNMQGENYEYGDLAMTKRIKSAYRSAGKFLGFFVHKKSK